MTRLLQTANAYFKVHQYRGMFAGDLYCVERGHDLIQRIAQLSKELVPVVEVDRARNLVADLEQRATLKRQEWRVNSANLTQILRLDPRAVVDPMEHDHLQITLIDPATPLPDLHKIALTNRPEIASQRAQVQAAEARIRREKARPFLPIVMINGFQTPGMLMQAGIFGLGPNSSLNNFIGRADESFQLIWQFDAFGVGNLARVKEQRGEQSKEYRRSLPYPGQGRQGGDRGPGAAPIGDGPGQAGRSRRAHGHHHLQRQLRGPAADHPLRRRPGPGQPAAGSGLRTRTHAVGIQRVLHDGRRIQLAQFEVFHALGYPAHEITYLRPPGNIEPVDTARPGYLPRVGNGPPPATN